MKTKKQKKPSSRAIIADLRQQLADLVSRAVALENELGHSRQTCRDRGKDNEALETQLDEARRRLGELRAHVLEYTLATNEPVTATTDRLVCLQRAIADGCQDITVYRTKGVNSFADLCRSL